MRDAKPRARLATSERRALLDAVTKPRDLQDRAHAFGDVHEFREWMSAPREDDEQDAASDDLLSGRVTIASTPVKHLGRHAGARRTCSLGHAYGALGGGVGYGYCGYCDLVLECERVPPPDDPARAHYDGDVWFPIGWDRRSRDGWIRARNERESNRSRPIDCSHDVGDFEDDEDGDDDRRPIATTAAMIPADHDLPGGYTRY
jgi:hypothetical protein